MFVPAKYALAISKQLVFRKYFSNLTIALAVSQGNKKKNFCNDDTGKKEKLPKEQESDALEPDVSEPDALEPDVSEPDAAEPDVQPEITPTKESDVNIQPIPNEEKKDSFEVSPTIEDIVSEVQEVVAEIKENLDNEED